MKKLLILSVLFLSTLLIVDAHSKKNIEKNVKAETSTDSTKRATPKEKVVYICTGSSSYAYHVKRNCKFLNQCSKEIKIMPVSEAKSLGRKPCKGCSVNK